MAARPHPVPTEISQVLLSFSSKSLVAVSRRSKVHSSSSSMDRVYRSSVPAADHASPPSVLTSHLSVIE